MQAFAMSPDVFEESFQQAQIGLALADLSTRHVRVNHAYAALLGRAAEDLVGVPFTEMMDARDRPAENSRVLRLLHGGERVQQAEVRYVAPDGSAVWVLHGVTLVPAEDGRPGWFAISAQDITERRRVEAELRTLTAALAEQSVRDPLTGLANRTLFEERLRASLSSDARTGASTAVLFLDLDGFKIVNDTHGHSVGDMVLRSVAERLAATVRPSDTLARIGGDEFVVLVSAANSEGVAALVDRLTAALSIPIEVSGLHLEVGVSVGTALAVAGDAQPQELLAQADRAMYAAKRAART